MSTLFDKTASWFAQKLADSINRTAQNETESRRLLRKLEGRSVGVELKGPSIRWVILVDSGKFQVRPYAPSEQDDEPEQITWIRATPGALMALAASGGKTAAGNLELSGDAETGQRFQQFFQSLKPDLEESLSRAFGDVAGVQIARLLRSAGHWASQAGGTLASNLSEYLTEESRQLVSQTEMADFLDEVDDLRDDVDRLEAKLQRLKGSE